MVLSVGLSAATFIDPRVATGSSGENSNLSNARAAGQQTTGRGASAVTNTNQTQSNLSTQQTTSSTATRTANGEELSEQEERVVQQLKQRDAEVRAHEQAHAAAGGTYASAPTYEYTVGPDGKRYATSGEVQIDTAPVRDNPEATIRKMDIVIRAALAPAEPSSQDLQVARQAQQTRVQAQAELAALRVEDLRSQNPNNENDSDTESAGPTSSQSPDQGIAAQADAAYRNALGLSSNNTNRQSGNSAEEIFNILSQASLFA